METRSLGPLEVPVVGIGCNNFGVRLDQEATTAVVDAAIEEGCKFFDTADIYGSSDSERLLGQALGSRRDQVLIATKFGAPYADEPGGASPSYVRHACERSLERLSTDRIDLYQLHIPDPTVPIAETMGALDELVQAGLVRAIGCSNVSPTQLAEANQAAPGTRFVSVQNQYSLLWREPEEELLAELDRQGAGLLPYYPLANGLLTGKYKKGEPVPEGARLALLPEERTTHWLSEAVLDVVEAIREISDAHEVDMVTLAFSWLLSRPQVSCVIAGASNPEQVRQNAAAAGGLDPSLIALLDAATEQPVT
jgi:aryl-alcohol dehydrogenase-like predicted oxidoreductase